jgi:hypothetical protein
MHNLINEKWRTMTDEEKNQIREEMQGTKA